MPLYEYECKKCHHRFEKIQKFSDKPMKKCPDCGGAVEQTISAPAVQFKGSGWYVTDYAGKGRKAAEKAEKDTAASASADNKKSDKSDKQTKDSSPVKKTSEKASSTKVPSGD